MIKRDAGPFHGTVTVAAASSIAALVDVIILMAIVTGVANCGEFISLMTAIAAKRAVRTRQRKPGNNMVERRLLPCIRAVTRSAVIAQLAFVNIIGSMTGDTLDGRFVERFRGGVTFGARDPGV